MWEYHIFRYDNHGLISATVMTDEPMLRHRIYQKKQNHAESSKMLFYQLYWRFLIIVIQRCLTTRIFDVEKLR